MWTLEKEGKKPEISLDFNDAKPTLTHMAIKSMINKGMDFHFLIYNLIA